MSLDIWLNDESGNCVFDRNITHNLGYMAKAAGIYEVLWHPDSINITKASQITPILENGLMDMIKYPEKYEIYNAANGWGMYEHFVPFCIAVLQACVKYPNATVKTST